MKEIHEETNPLDFNFTYKIINFTEDTITLKLNFS
jgi:hypothetical protein